MIIKDNEPEVSYTPCLLTKPALHLWFPRPQIQPVFLLFQISSMPRVLQHFHSNADRAYNTLHFAMQSRVPKGAFAPFGYPHIFVSANRKLKLSSSPSLPRKYRNRHSHHL